MLEDADTRLSVNDKIYYNIPDIGTVIAGLNDQTYYYVSFVNTTSFAVSETKGGANVNLTETRDDNPGEIHYISTLSKFAISST